MELRAFVKYPKTLSIGVKNEEVSRIRAGK
jgi:hypothetical protein